ncbi:MAG: hypothetical protein BWX81_00052 [Spirochaetes bacterium ADurb.Bin110]|nr:MAG: hypothetical protein BWX81_00052 [Spirochaetes bacterium ADurb.Bin110]
MSEALTYAKREQRKRTILSYIIAIVMYAVLIGAGLLFDILKPENIDFGNKSLIVNIQGPVTNDIGKGSPIEKDEGLVAEKPAPPPAPVPESQAQTIAKPKPTETVTPTPAAEAKPTPTPITPETAVVQEPEKPWIPGERGPGSRISSSESSVLSPGEGQVPWGTGEAVRITKAEKGNTVETTLGGSSESVGQSLYVPIYLSMPLPEVVPASLFNAIPPEIVPPNTLIASAESRKRAFLNYYSWNEKEYRLTNPVPLEIRDKLWEMLEDAGYNVEKADYKAGRSLNAVVIGFSITKDRQLKGVDILQSSGDSDIDAAVLYGFKRASFWNKSGDTIQGRFVYRF